MNNTQPHSNKTWIGLIIIVVIAALAYFFVSGSSTAVTGTLSTSNASVGAQVLGLLGQIQTLKIETAFFSDTTFRTLRDYSVTIPPVNVGRPNPFAPLSNEAAAAAAGDSVSRTR